ncbi:zinc transporter 4-like [Scleropages formosus]|uniref:Probable proton-coupled zinc antiporter SLC30A4 n=1 Tax=Scleropages formosus TaxID=113540 RepID=A0A8C9RVJ7_SCLFO|nr:zinc transporter 4-like [Scleropages formosus]
MSGAHLMSRVRSVFRKERADCGLSDASTFDWSSELEDEEVPRFSELRVVVSDGPQSNGAPGATDEEEEDDDDDSLLGSSSGLGPVAPARSCEGCRKRRERTSRGRVMKRLGCASLLYFLFMVGELTGGYVANSLAIMTDALHMLTDLIGIIVSLLALWLSARSPSKRFTFGLHRLEVVSAGISVLLIYILTGVLLNEAVQRTIHQDFDIDGDVMLITAAVGVAVNLVMGFLLNQSGHLHSHSHSQEQPPPNGPHNTPQGSLAVRAAFIHALGDLVQSVGVLIAAYIVRFKPEYKIADPICTYIFSVLVLFTTVRIVRDTGIILLEGVPRHLDVARIREELQGLEGVHAVEDLNVWALTGDKTAALVHLQLSPSSGSSWEEVQGRTRHLLLDTYGFYKCTVQLQSHRINTPSTCSHCQAPSA